MTVARFAGRRAPDCPGVAFAVFAAAVAFVAFAAAVAFAALVAVGVAGAAGAVAAGVASFGAARAAGRRLGGLDGVPSGAVPSEAPVVSRAPPGSASRATAASTAP
ncbi:MAG: hypothetical protein ACKVZ6_16280, partial [Kineosporiaceae bacterium]